MTAPLGLDGKPYPVIVRVVFQVEDTDEQAAFEQAYDWLLEILHPVPKGVEAQVIYSPADVPLGQMTARSPWRTVGVLLKIRDPALRTSMPAPAWLREAIERAPKPSFLRVVDIGAAEPPLGWAERLLKQRFGSR